MEKYIIFGVLAAILVIAAVLLIFGVGKNSSQNTAVNQNYYSTVNSSLRQTISSDILGLQTFQNNIPAGKDVLYSANYSLSTSAMLSNGTGENSSEYASGIISMIKSSNGNSEAVSNFTVSTPVYGIEYSLNSSSLVFSIGNNTYLCGNSAATGGNAVCTALNQSMANLTDSILQGLKLNDISVLRAYNITYDGFKCLFTEASFSMQLNDSNSSLTAAKSGSQLLKGTETSCKSAEYGIPVMSSLAASISVNSNISNVSVTSNSFIDYNMSIKSMNGYTAEITKSSLPK